ncbi:nucleotidyltransferase domain-containing protein [Rhodomicrobium sp. Az07]|uniref:nucleotidyltransferase family protein n=1 Tax=Rhodomicrobium sp. Az07 TaxID=2839034 RepID=UPI001BE7E105|nr:nucleotidyltransferase domain-containing protein [Rhodomicrobium sp. Az07]MBT3070295.1 nucleotidyltransferase domain-containing protein [Rhodomicrobium sp. Az07]
MKKGLVLQRLRDQEAELREFGVRSLSVFGSVARGDENDDSDIDVAVTFDPARTPRGLAYFGLLERLQGRLAETLGRDVDLVPEPTTRPSLQNEIDRDRVVAF